MTLRKMNIEDFKRETSELYTQRCQEEELGLKETSDSSSVPCRIPQAQVMNSKLIALASKMKGE